MFGFGKKKKIVEVKKPTKYVRLRISWRDVSGLISYSKKKLVDKNLESNLPEAGITVSHNWFIQNKRRMNRLRMYPRKNKTLCLTITKIKLHNRTENFYRLMFWNCLSGRFVGEISYDESKKKYRVTHLSKVKNRFLKWSN